MPGMTAGRVTVKKAWVGGAPQFMAAFSRSGSSRFAAAATAQIMNGRLMTQQARPTGQSEPSEAQPAEDQHQAEARDDQRDRERQQQVELQARCAAAPPAGQRQGGERAGRQASEGADGGDPQASAAGHR